MFTDKSQGHSTLLATTQVLRKPAAGPRRLEERCPTRTGAGAWIQQGQRILGPSLARRHPRPKDLPLSAARKPGAGRRGTHAGDTRGVGGSSKAPPTGRLYRSGSGVPASPSRSSSGSSQAQGGPEMTRLITRDWRKQKLLFGRHGNCLPFSFRSWSM